MSKIFSVALLAFFSVSLNAQTPYKAKKRKKDFFGKENFDNRQVGNFGMHLGAGPSFSIASDNKEQSSDLFTNSIGDTYKVDITQKGKVGFNASLGAIYFTKSRKIVDYFELAVGFNYYRGTESTTLTDATNRDLPTLTGEGKYSAGLLSGRFGIHKILPIPGTKMFVDNGLALHGDYNLLQADATYSNFVPNFAKYSPTFTFQANYSLGFGFQIAKGSYLVPTVFVPVLSFSEFGKQAVHWFDSKYYPINCQLRWIYRFKKSRSKTSCTTPDKGPMPPPEPGK